MAESVTVRKGSDEDRTAQLQTQDQTNESTRVVQPGDKLSTETPGGTRTTTRTPGGIQISFVIERVNPTVT